MNSGDEEEEEVTFLLRLRPTPSPPASRRRKSSIGCSRPVSGSGWDVVVERRGGTPPGPDKTGAESRPISGTAWGMTSQPSVSPSAPPSSEIFRPWVCPTPHHAWAAPYGQPFPDVSWTQAFVASSQDGMDYRHSDPTIIPQTVSAEDDYRRQLATPDMFFHPLSMDKTNFHLPNNLPLHPHPQNPTHSYKNHAVESEDCYQRRNSPDPKGTVLRKKSCSVDNWSICETDGCRDTPKSVRLSHGNLTVTNQNSSSSDNCVPPREGFVAVNNEIRSGTPKEPNRKGKVSSDSQKNDFLNNFHRYSLPPGTFTRALSMDQIHRCGVSKTLGQESSDGRVDTKAPGLPPLPPKPARFRRDEHRRSQQLQETMPWVCIEIDLPHFVDNLHVHATFR
jgi:hypothetical protein